MICVGCKSATRAVPFSGESQFALYKAPTRMLCTLARRLLPRASASIHRGLAMPGKLSLQLPQVSTQAAPGTASRRTCADIKDRGLRRRASTEAVPEATGLTLDVDERAPRVKHRIPQRR